MSKHAYCVLVLLCIGLCAAGVNGQICGDVNVNGQVNIGDLALIHQYLAADPGIDAYYSIDLWAADCDDRSGVTIGDMVRLADYFFSSPLTAVPDCDHSSTYSFAEAPDDTVFIPYTIIIPDDIDHMVMPVVTSFQPGTRGLYVPALISGDHALSFAVDSVISVSSQIMPTNVPPLWSTWENDPDTLVLCAIATDNDTCLTGRRKIYNIYYSRTGPGTGSIFPEFIDRDGSWRMAIAREGDLLVPVVRINEIPLPVPVLSVSETSLSFSVAAGNVSSTGIEVDFTSEDRTVGFTLEPTEPWIVIDPDPAEALTTPQTISVSADATQLPIGEYTGQILITDVDPTDTETPVTAIDVYVEVKEPGVYPRGDVNCDGIISIGDIMRLIDHLFITRAPLPVCE